MTMMTLWSCVDRLDIQQESDVPDDKGIGELVLFSSGNNANVNSRAVIPYMEKEGRFVCKMYYHAKATDTDSSPFDVENTPVTSWLRVNDNEGNSVYWQKDYDMDGVDKEHQDYKDYGFDSRAQYFYWRNRLYHVFLAYTDLNKLKKNVYGTEQGKLFMYPEYDDKKKTKTGEDKTWVPNGHRMMSFVKPTDGELRFSGLVFKDDDIDNSGIHFPLSGDNTGDPVSDDLRTATKTRIIELITNTDLLQQEEKTALIADIDRPKQYSDPETTSEGTFHNARWWVRYNPENINDDGSIKLELAKIYSLRQKQKTEDIISEAPANTFDMRRKPEMKTMADQPDPLIALTKMKPMGATQEANRVRLYFKHQFSQIQVNLTKAETTGEITRDNIVKVELLGVTEKGYVFTNITTDGKQIDPSYDPVVKSKYTEEQLARNPHGTSFSMFDMYDDTKYDGSGKTDAEIEAAKAADAANNYGYPLGSLKSFNAIAFGQLQAIRITWKEEPTDEIYTAETAQQENDKHLVSDTQGRKPGDAGYQTTYEADYTPVNAGDVVPPVHHVVTFPITVDDRNHSLVNLQSGFRYVYDFELRRGTIAFIRATIVDWLLDDKLNYTTSGTIDNSK